MSERLIQLKEMLADDPKDSFLCFAIAKEHEKLGNLEEALEMYLVLKGNDPEYVGLYYHLGQLYEILEQHENALKVYDEGIQIAKKQSDFHALSELNGVKTNLEMEL